jgi:signal transduction histidine kinase
VNKKTEAMNAEFQQKMKEKDEFLLNVFHEIRNPLNILLGNLELASLGCIESKLASFLDIAKTALLRYGCIYSLRLL